MTRDEIDQEFEQYYAETFGDPCTSDLQKAVSHDVWIAAIEMYKLWASRQIDNMFAQRKSS